VCLNGEPVKLLGYGRHDTSPHVGHALPDFQRQLDVAAAAGVGSNYLRLGHYTQAPAMATLCDEVGLMNGIGERQLWPGVLQHGCFPMQRVARRQK